MVGDGNPIGIMTGGAYGLALPDLLDARHLLAESPGWPSWRIDHRFPPSADAENGKEVLTDERARLRLSGGGFVEIDRKRRSSVLVLPTRPRDTEVVHPYLGLTAATAARWRRWCTFHAGALVTGRSAWGILGPKGAGKSTFLAWFAGLDGGAALTDDVLVVDRSGQALSGPRCIDLRRDAADRFGPAEALGMVGARERWRLTIGSAPASAPLRGWIQLQWGETTELQPLSPSATFSAITGNLALRILPPDPEDLLELAALPAWRLVRPRNFDALRDLEPVLRRILVADVPEA